jgi:ABC-type glycerol-3-phosphate transport system substrate-binding protein
VRRRNMILVVLAAVLAAATPATAAASASVNGPDDVITTVDFEAYAPGTEITNQYAGITFEYPTSADFTYGTPADGVVCS